MEAELRNIKSYMLGAPELVITEAYSYNMERSSWCARNQSKNPSRLLIFQEVKNM